MLLDGAIGTWCSSLPNATSRAVGFEMSLTVKLRADYFGSAVINEAQPLQQSCKMNRYTEGHLPWWTARDFEWPLQC